MAFLRRAGEAGNGISREAAELNGEDAKGVGSEGNGF
jgi:hypothetical protein